jgi:hypothetical protein
MTRDDLIRMAHEAGFHKWYSDPERVYHFGCIENFAALVAAHEREARQAAQIENEALKARIARAGLERQHAVIAEREACAKTCESLPMQQERDVRDECAAAIRARSQE